MQRRPQLSAGDYVSGIERGDRAMLARAITLVESSTAAHRRLAVEVLERLMPRSGKAFRAGITGVPGVGKSTFIEAFGLHLCEAGHRVAVLAVDPTSTVSAGSLLGDKTRMELLSRRDDAFIRPSPSGATPGGVARKTRETMLLCEAFGFDVVLVETVGVGQGEVTVRSMVDFFLLLTLTGAGDELQGFKRGIMELVDGILVTKADGANAEPAAACRGELARVVHMQTPITPGWEPRVAVCSARDGRGMAEAWEMMQVFDRTTRESGVFAARRRAQSADWLRALLDDGLHDLFHRQPGMREAMQGAAREVEAGTRLPSRAADELLRAFQQALSSKN
jgi:LAO/AO transport system kinase